MSKSNINLNAAKKAKQDEFYTQLEDVEKELVHYIGKRSQTIPNHFANKTVFLNCDDPKESNFWKYFDLNFEHLGLKKLISTHYSATKATYKLEKTAAGTVKTNLEQNGDFRSPESLALLDESDIVVTNPPFSLFGEFVDTLITHQKQFLILGPANALTYNTVFPHLKKNLLWVGMNTGAKTFEVPEGYEGKSFLKDGKRYSKLGNVYWYTNLDLAKRHEKLFLSETYFPDNNPGYKNYPAVEVSRTKNIPKDYDGAMGVPISFIERFNPAQFEILDRVNAPVLAPTGKKIYKRLIVKRKQP